MSGGGGLVGEEGGRRGDGQRRGLVGRESVEEDEWKRSE